MSDQPAGDPLDVAALTDLLGRYRDEREAAERARTRALDGLADVARRANAQGVSERVIARTAGVSRLTVQRWLGKASG